MEICRACLSTDKNMVHIDEDFIFSYNLLTNLKIMLLDDMPQFSCETCVDTVKFFIKFREKCISSESTLQQIKLIEKIKPEVTDTDNDAKNDLNNGTNIKKELKDEKPIDYSILENCINEHFGDLDDDVNYLIKCEEIEEIEPDQLPKNKRRKKNLKTAKIEVLHCDMKASQLLTTKTIKKKPKAPKKETDFIQLFCGLCSKTFEDKNALTSHLESHKRDSQCEICMELCNSWPQLLSHRLKHVPGKQRKCHICSKRYVSCIYLEHHYIITHYPGKMNKLTCKICCHTYDNPLKLRKHMWHVHSGNTYICDLCSKIFSNKQRLKLHMVSHSDNKAYICDLCGFSCKYNSGLKDHKARKHAVEKCTCKNCKRVFKDRPDYEKHKCNKVLKVCPICGKQLNRNVKYKVHLATHKDGGQYKCERCPAAYKTRGALAVHNNRHDGVRTKQCEYCPAKFYSSSVLIKHRRTHTGEKPYVCKICQKGFTGNHNLKVHMKVHGEMLIVKKIKDPDIVAN